MRIVSCQLSFETGKLLGVMYALLPPSMACTLIVQSPPAGL